LLRIDVGEGLVWLVLLALLPVVELSFVLLVALLLFFEASLSLAAIVTK
jgi:hypothetical protein